MNHERNKIFFRQMQLQYDFNNDGNQTNAVVVLDTDTGIAKYVPGNVPLHAWQDMSMFVSDDGKASDLDKFGVSWDAVNQSSNGSSTNQTGSNYDKGVTGNFTFWGKAFEFIRAWLMDSPEQILNAVEVKIFDAYCGRQYRIFEIKADNLTYVTSDECRVDVKLREQDLTWHAVYKTAIYDNWQNWFNELGTSTYEHPCFLTVIDPRPRILSSVRVIFHIFNRALHSGALGLASFFLPGNEDDTDFRRIVSINKFVAAPLIADYITNVCNKTGIGINTMFHDADSPYKNVCIYFPNAAVLKENNDDNVTANELHFDWANRWLIALSDLADKLKPVFAAEWYVTPNNTFVFRPLVELLRDVKVIYDFTKAGALPILSPGITYTFNGDKKAAYGRYQYTTDGSDLASQEVQNYYNDLVDYDGPAYNPMLEGEKDNTVEFAPTGFLRDGTHENYVRELVNDGETGAYILIGLISVITAVLVAGTITLGAGIALGVSVGLFVAAVADIANHLRDDIAENDIYKGAVRMTAEQCLTPRLLLWDGESKARAKVVQQEAPAANLYYNPDATDYFTINKSVEPGTVYNYPMYFESKFTENLFDRYHDAVDNPLKSLENNQTWSMKVELCCEMLTILGCWDGDFIKIGYLLKLESRTKYDVFGRIQNVAVDYTNMQITIKGKVIKKKK